MPARKLSGRAPSGFPRGGLRGESAAGAPPSHRPRPKTARFSPGRSRISLTAITAPCLVFRCAVFLGPCCKSGTRERADNLPSALQETGVPTANLAPSTPARRCVAIPDRTIFTLDGLLNRNMSVKGELSCAGTLRIDGSLRGSTLNTDHVIVGESGSIHAEIRGDEIGIRGSVFGNVEGKRRLQIAAPGLLRGDVPAPPLVIDEGGALEGTSHDVDKTTDKDSAPIDRTGSLDAVASRSS